MFFRAISQRLRPLSLRHPIIHRFTVQENLLWQHPTIVTFRGVKTRRFDDAKQPFADTPKNSRRAKQSSVDKEKPENEEELLLHQHNPDVFGTFSEAKQLIEDASEELKVEGNAAKRESTSNGPIRAKPLTTRDYANMIKHHLKFNRVKEAIDVLEVRMIEKDRVQPENHLYNLLITECGRLGHTQKAFELFNRMKQSGAEVTSGTYTVLFNVCSCSPCPKTALELAHNLRRIMLESSYVPNKSNYNAMIQTFGRFNDLHTAFEVIDEMNEHNLPLKVDSFNVLLQTLISDKEHGFRHALLVWHRMHQKRLCPNLFSFNLLLKCVQECGIGDPHSMRNVIEQILSDNNGETVLGGSQQPLNDNDEHTTNTGDQQIEPTDDGHGTPPNLISRTPHFGSLVALKTVKKPEHRLLLLGGISGFVEEMKTAGVVPDIKLFTNMLDVIPSTLAAEHRLLEIIHKMDIPVDIDFFNILMKKRSMRFDYESAKVRSCSCRGILNNLLHVFHIVSFAGSVVADRIGGTAARHRYLRFVSFGLPDNG